MEQSNEKEQLTLHERVRRALSTPKAAERLVAFLEKIGAFKEENKDGK